MRHHFAVVAWLILLAAHLPANAVVRGGEAKVNNVPLEPPGEFDSQWQSEKTTWRALAIAANSRRHGPWAGLYSHPRHPDLSLLFVPGVGIVLAHMSQEPSCANDTVRGPYLETADARFDPAKAGYVAAIRTSCSSTGSLYAIRQGSRYLLVTEMEGYVHNFNATEGEADLADFAFHKLAPLGPPGPDNTALPAHVLSRLFREPITLKVLDVQVVQREVYAGFFVTPLQKPGYRVTAKTDKGASDRLFVGMALWGLDRCERVSVAQVDERTSTVQFDTLAPPETVIVPGDRFSSSRKARGSLSCPAWR